MWKVAKPGEKKGKRGITKAFFSEVSSLQDEVVAEKATKIGDQSPDMRE